MERLENAVGTSDLNPDALMKVRMAATAGEAIERGIQGQAQGKKDHQNNANGYGMSAAEKAALYKEKKRA